MLCKIVEIVVIYRKVKQKASGHIMKHLKRIVVANYIKMLERCLKLDNEFSL